eukprot:CAMPEP_0117010578 /NCGR_PEP_ID=MMETSP0472-20121206/9286_1 /TAXON_ID=693140 ORGANISM="Tiarina fusus, Strain LIS" /NCGR_SAMPLE_ID=MMETSP0472 /ASSEMBLY_ACC=CAM_ASM_000603 /LENGTH=90 /DNA_ID=CAMNT_0004713143 /DNA_START=228 /DNA_END=500 /DNA_ORIENTATION=-
MVLGGFPVLGFLKSKYYDPKYVAPALEAQRLDLIEKDDYAKKTLFFNRIGGPTRPHRSLEDLMTFLAGSWTYDQFFDFISYNAGMDVNTD